VIPRRIAEWREFSQIVKDYGPLFDVEGNLKEQILECLKADPVLLTDFVKAAQCWAEIRWHLLRNDFDWQEFSDAVEEHIAKYTIPQYGDWPDDQVTNDFTVADMKANIKRYYNRIGKGARGQDEAVRDCLKGAHYFCMLRNKILGEDRIKRL